MKICFSILLTVFSIQTLIAQNIDIDLLRTINLQRDKNLDGTFSLISNTTDVINVAVPLTIISIGLINKDKKLLHKGYYIGASYLCGIVVSSAIKELVRRDRPFVTYPDIQKLSDGGSYSFPSGHTTVAFSTATSISIAFPKWYVIVPAFTWAGLVGYSRMDLGVHYPSDVLAGMAFGSASAWLTYKGQQWLVSRKKNKK